jgi:hypothetical protein
MKPAKKPEEKLIGEVLEDLCREDLADLDLPDMSCKVFIASLLLAKEGKLVMSEESSEHFRQRGIDAMQLSKNIEKLAEKAHPFVGVPEYLKPLAESTKANSRAIGDFLRGHARKDNRNGCDQGIVMVLRGILSYKETFNRWAALQRVIEKVYLADVAGGPRKVDDVSAGALCKAAERIRQGPPLRRLTPAGVQSALKIASEASPRPMGEEGE